MGDFCRRLFFCCGSTCHARRCSIQVGRVLTWLCSGRSKVDYDNVLADSEREAVADLLNYLENVLHTHRSQVLVQKEQLRRTRREHRIESGQFANHEPRIQRAETDFFSGEPLAALSTLVYSQNIDLQRSASLTFAEITERGGLRASTNTGGG